MAATAGALWFLVSPRPTDTLLTVRALRFADNTIRNMGQLDFLMTSGGGMSVSPDERYVLVTRPDPGGSDLLIVNDFR